MAHDEENSFDSYQKDMFDNPPKGPVGVHRGNTPLAKRVIPYAIVLVVAVLAGLLVYGVYSGDLSKVFSAHETTQQQTVTPKKTVKKKTTTKNDAKSDTKDQANKGETATPQQQPAVTVNKGTAVSVVNATRTSGYAAQKAAVLQQAGYTQVSAVNPAGDVPSSSVVWYQNESDKATAQDVANLLGISSVQQQSGASAPIEAVLLN